MDKGSIEAKLASFEDLNATIKNRKKSRTKTDLLKTMCVMIVAILLAIVINRGVICWIILLSLSFGFCVWNFKLYKYFKKSSITVGTVKTIRHEYSVAHKKGTSGWGGSGPLYTTLRQEHDVVLVIKSFNDNEKSREIICLPQYEKVFRVGDIVLVHPELDYPANITNADTCICMKCGTIQSTKNGCCYNCKSTLIHSKSML